MPKRRKKKNRMKKWGRGNNMSGSPTSRFKGHIKVDKNVETGGNKCGFINKKKVPSRKDAWEVKIDTLTECGKAPESIPVWFLPLAKVKVDFLMDKMEGTEWLAYLLGDKINFVVTDIWVPEQEVTSTCVDNVDCPEYNRLSVIGVIHSHHTMGNGFSGTDNDWINQNHVVSLCVSNNGIKGHVRWKTPCGGLKFVEAKAQLKLETDFNEEKFGKLVESNVKKKTWQHSGNYTAYRQGQYKQYYPTYNNVNPAIKNQKKINDITEEENFWETKGNDEVEELNFDSDPTLEQELMLLDEAPTNMEDVV